MQPILLFTACTSSKDDSSAIRPGTAVVEPCTYLEDSALREQLLRTREAVLSAPSARRGSRTTLGLDLYVRTGRTYQGLRSRPGLLPAARAHLEAGTLQWFFLSGGYGVLHALEPATSCQATFSRGIARQKDIPYTTPDWASCLPAICSRIVDRYGRPTYVLGSRDYTAWFASFGEGVTTIESTGRQGPAQLSPILADLLEAAFTGRLDAFDARFPRPFTKL